MTNRYIKTQQASARFFWHLRSVWFRAISVQQCLNSTRVFTSYLETEQYHLASACT